MLRHAAVLVTLLVFATTALTREPIPDRLVVLTFDDASKSHYTVARPLLTKHKFGATFFVTEGWDFATNQKDYMTWDEIAQLHKDGFEIGNHTIDHKSVTDKTIRDLPAQIKAINARCKEHSIPQPVSFAYPGNAITKDALPVLKDLGIKFARRGGAPEHPYKDGRGFAYEPGLDHPLLVPTAGDARPNWTLDDLKIAVAQAKHGKIAVLQFHGVPDTAHDWVTTKKEQFEAFVKYLADEKFTVIAMRDLAKFVDPEVAPSDPFGVIEDRKKLVEAKRDGSAGRSTKSDDELRYWLDNALVQHRFTATEAGAALDLTADEVTAAAKRLGIDPTKRPERKPGDTLVVLPYPGGRHPRTGFRDGAIRPQRETKVSAFAPWSDGGYAVADVPEAVWFEPTPKKPELLYLAHTHVPTTWDRQKIALAPLEWTRSKDGALALERPLPNKVTLGSKVVPGRDGVRMEFRVTNGTDQTLTGLRVQMCVMLAGLTGFDKQTNDNKVFVAPFAACKDATGKRWVITGWERCGRAWGNPPCPCLHADPVVEDCPPGQTKAVRGWQSFYEGTDIDSELKRLKAVAFP
ncbi:Polysaccharide deacetylase [Gemmata sp. SH-PL17]|uniref:polysaccharide deacetylase family protein n=1 Tax=Gemmata sp. SH-PL17 TaxID=1630693 RepID=UPI00078CEF21|nr:polysaccharide deacetylase family protein [Gemmata sp. SH-PL17]AMV24930.1 Polysaccharide deacetylase [Gemmata sp. SH-PL17]